MLIEMNQITIEHYIATFTKKFKNFANKAPCQISFTVTPMGLVIKELSSGKEQKFNIDINVDVKMFINQIKDWLVENAYPVLTEVVKTETNYTTEEQDNLVIEQGLDLKQVLSMKKIEISKIKYRIERLILMRDRIIVRNLETNQKYLYEMKMPVSQFLRNTRTKWNSEYSFEVFKKYSVLLKELEDVGPGNDQFDFDNI